MPLRIEAERIKLPHDFIQSPTAKGCNVFDCDPARLDFFDDPRVFKPEAALCALKSCASARDTDVLAGEATTDKIGNNSVCSKALIGKMAHVFVDGDVGPVLSEDASAVGFDFAECDCSHPGPFEPETKSTDA